MFTQRHAHFFSRSSPHIHTLSHIQREAAQNSHCAEPLELLTLKSLVQRPLNRALTISLANIFPFGLRAFVGSLRVANLHPNLQYGNAQQRASERVRLFE